jgi:hypothetical protein
MKNLFLGLAMAAGLGASAATASTVNISYQSGGVFGPNNLQQTVTIATSGPGIDGNVQAGLFHLTGDNGIGDFLAFCVDLGQYLNNPQQAVVNATLFGANTLSRIDSLFSNALGGMGLGDVIDTAVEAAGLQVALWEVIMDGDTGLDLSSGTFSASNNAGALAQAQTYLDGMAGPLTGLYDMTFFESAQNQDVMTVSPAPVPLPASGLLIVGGLAGLAGLRRRKAA